MRARLGLVLIGVLALPLAGCTAVPSHSAPQTISFVPQNPTVVSSERPPPKDASPREIVQDFLTASAEQAGAQGSARDYLTRSARRSWPDSKVTIVDSTSVSNYDPQHPAITVRGREIGSLTEQGIYQPTLLGTGSGGKISNNYQYRIKKVHGQYRIDKLPGAAQGLLLTLGQFSATYLPHTLEFYDLVPHYLIPDLRYSPLHGSALADWLISQLAAGPRPELQNAVIPADLPAPTNATPVTVKLGGVTTVAVPGAAQDDADVRNRLAAQIGQTLVDVVGTGLLSITDGGKPIQIPKVGSTQFVPSQFEADLGPAEPPPELYYVRRGRVVGENGKNVPGTGVDGTPPLTSVALTAAADQDPNSLSVAGDVVTGKTDRLWVGTQQVLRSTDVSAPVTDADHLPLSRPAWAPGRAEVWIGAGTSLYRLTVSGVAALRHAVPLPSNAPKDAPIQAVRISPDGSRIALVLGQRGLTQLYEAVIVRSAGQVRVGDLNAISPAKVAITDVAWNSPLKLFAIGYLQSNSDARACETNVDGSGWTMSLMPGLPSGPDALTITPNAVTAWVEVNDTVWKQSGDDWVSPSTTGISQVPGSNPIYLE